MAFYGIMKLVVLLALWFPVTMLLIAFSLVNLLYHKDRQFKVAIASEVKAQSLSFISPSPYPTMIIAFPTQDIRIIVLKKFLSNYKSPLEEYAEDLVKTADLWGLDYALLPSIAMQESGGCKRLPLDSYNCWGYGIYANKVIRFSSYQEAMNQVAKTIKEAYIKKGLTNPTLVEDIWAPPSRGLWSNAVNFFIGKIRDYEKNTSAS